MPIQYEKDGKLKEISFTRLFFGVDPVPQLRKTMKVTIIIRPLLCVWRICPRNKTTCSPSLNANESSEFLSDVLVLKKAATVTPPLPPPPPPPPPPPLLMLEPVADAEPTIVADSTPIEEVKDTEKVPGWTEVQDALLIGLKAQNKTWKEIGALIEGKDTEDLRDRYKELIPKAEEKIEEKSADNSEEIAPVESGGEEEKQEKGKKGKNKKEGKREEAGEKQGKNKEGKQKQGKEKQVKGNLDSDLDAAGILKNDEDGSEAQEHKKGRRSHKGHSVIQLDEDERFSVEEVST